jgi:hypothetical protein
LEGNEVDVLGAIGKGPGYKYFGAVKLLLDVKYIFDKPPEEKKKRFRFDVYK